MPTKKDLRATYLEKRLNQPAAAAATANAAILQHCRELDYSNVQYVHLFLPIDAKKEVDTRPLAQWLREVHPQVHIVLSGTNMQTLEMLHYLWDAHTVLTTHRYGMTEPAGGTLVAPSCMDLVFVPLLAFDLRGHRAGYGKGMYDRFLRQCRPDVRTVGLSQFDPVAAIDDADDLDVRLKMVITPRAIYDFKS